MFSPFALFRQFFCFFFFVFFSQLQKLTSNMCQILNIPYDYCSAAITELQTSALDKLKARDEFAQTGRIAISDNSKYKKSN